MLFRALVVAPPSGCNCEPSRARRRRRARDHPGSDLAETAETAKRGRRVAGAGRADPGQAGASRFARLEAAVRQRSEHVRLVERVAVSLHSSLFSFRRPQCRSFDESYSGIGFAPWSASIIPTRACIRGPRSSAAINSASVAACHSGLCCCALGSFMMYAAASFNVVRALPFGGTIGSSKGRDQGMSLCACRIRLLSATIGL